MVLTIRFWTMTASARPRRTYGSTMLEEPGHFSGVRLPLSFKAYNVCIIILCTIYFEVRRPDDNKTKFKQSYLHYGRTKNLTDTTALCAIEINRNHLFLGRVFDVSRRPVYLYNIISFHSDVAVCRTCYWNLINGLGTNVYNTALYTREVTLFQNWL